MVVWWATRAECIHAICRRRIEGSFSAQDEQRARDRLDALAERWLEIQPTRALRNLAEQRLCMYPLRTADALQLATALMWSGQRPQARGFVCLDDRGNRGLRTPARMEGFQILPSQL